MNFFHRLADHKPVKILQIGQALQKQNALDQLVGMLHFLNRFFLKLFRKLVITPVERHARMQEILVDRGQLKLQRMIEIFDNFLIAFHKNRLFCSLKQF